MNDIVFSIQAWRLVRIITIGVLSLLVVLAVAGAPVVAATPRLGGLQSKPAITLTPPVATAAVGGEFELVVRIDNVNRLLGAQYRITFDATRLQVVDADPAMDGVQIGGAEIFDSPPFTAMNAANNEAGTIEYSVTWIKPTPDSRAPSGSGVLGRITFRVVGEGSSTVQFVNVDDWTKIIVEWPGGLPQEMSATWAPATVHSVPGFHLFLPLVCKLW
jgi:hypothetical protein